MDSKGVELAVSTLVLMALGVILLIGLVYVLTDGFSKFRGSTEPLVKTTEYAAIREACKIACQAQNYPDFCCTRHKIQSMNVSCDDSRLDVPCPEASCGQVFCQ